MNHTELISILVFNLSLYLAVALFFFKSWFDILRPDLFYIFNIYENDFFNKVTYKFFIPIDGNKDQRVIQECEYDRSGFKPILNSRGVYEWNFEEGNNIPISFTTQRKIDGIGIISSRKKNYFQMLVKGEKTMMDYLPLILIGVGLLIAIFFMYTVNQNQQTTQLLINVTRRIT